MESMLVTGPYTITKDRRTSYAVIRNSKYGKKSRHISSKNFPNRTTHVHDVDLFLVECTTAGISLVYLECALRDRKLTKCAYEDVFFFGEQFPDEQCQSLIVGSHTPYVYDNTSWQLMLGTQFGARSISLIHPLGPFVQQTRFLTTSDSM